MQKSIKTMNVLLLDRQMTATSGHFYLKQDL